MHWRPYCTGQFRFLEVEIDEISSKILKLKNDLKSLRQEKDIYREDIKEIKRLDNFEKIKSKSIKSFVDFSLKINNINYYIEKILTKHNDNEKMKTLVISELHDQYFKNYLEYFKKIEEDIDKEIKFLEQELKYIAFTKMDKIESPYISNIGYFENRLLGYKKLKTMFYSFFSNKKIIKTDVFEENYPALRSVKGKYFYVFPISFGICWPKSCQNDHHSEHNSFPIKSGVL